MFRTIRLKMLVWDSQLVINWLKALEKVDNYSFIPFLTKELLLPSIYSTTLTT